MDYFFDNQLRRYLLQFMRIFSDVKVESDPDSNGIRVQKRVPVKYGDLSRMSAHILAQNSQNTIFSAPSMAVTIFKLEMNDSRRQDPTFVSIMQGIERKFDADNNMYTAEQGNRYTVERYMPVPYDLSLKLDIWTTNTHTKMQIIEQLIVLFNPGLQIQQTDNAFDWSAITEVMLTDINWTNRNIPVGADSKDEFATLTFKMPIWINPPARVKRQSLIEKIVHRVTDVGNMADIDVTEAVFDITQFGSEITQLIITPGNYKINVGYEGNAIDEITLLNKYGATEPGLTWGSITEQYGTITPGVTKIRLKTSENLDSDEGDILGFVAPDPLVPNKLIFTVNEDTLPSTITSGPITAIVDPTVVAPGNGIPAASYGQRYMISSSYSDDTEISLNNSPGWGTVVAHENDIIEYNGTQWEVSFDSAMEVANQYVKNIADGQHYKFNGTNWIYTYLGQYNPGYWRVENLNNQ